ncbi:hypothetical protein [Cohnella laeviribosi]|uniref:hypothetical protein n=1 Tax=Cohnella laeviribosi TaxID=380174 RepID=UPI003D1C101F
MVNEIVSFILFPYTLPASRSSQTGSSRVSRIFEPSPQERSASGDWATISAQAGNGRLILLIVFVLLNYFFVLLCEFAKKQTAQILLAVTANPFFKPPLLPEQAVSTKKIFFRKTN